MVNAEATTLSTATASFQYTRFRDPVFIRIEFIDTCEVYEESGFLVEPAICKGESLNCGIIVVRRHRNSKSDEIDCIQSCWTTNFCAEEQIDRRQNLK